MLIYQGGWSTAPPCLSLSLSACPSLRTAACWHSAPGDCCMGDAIPERWCTASPCAFPTVPLGQSQEHRPLAPCQRSCWSCGQRGGDPPLCPTPGCGSATPRGASGTSRTGSAEALTPVATGLGITAGSAPSALRLGGSWTLQPMNSVWIWRLVAGNPSHDNL